MPGMNCPSSAVSIAPAIPITAAPRTKDLHVAPGLPDTQLVTLQGPPPPFR